MSNALRRRPRLLTWCQLSLAAFCLLLALLTWPEAKGRISGTFFVFSLCCLAAYWSHSGWIIPGTILGVFFGALVLDPAVKRGTAESEMWETITWIVTGGVGGLFMGYMTDWLGAVPTSEARQPSISPVASAEPGPEKDGEQPSA